MTAQCARCGKPMPDTGPICHRPCATELTEALTAAAGHAQDTEAVLARQTRYGAGQRGGSGEPLPVDLTASAHYGAIALAVSGWATILVEEGYTRPIPRWRPAAGPLCPPRGHRCEHASCAAIRDHTQPSPLAHIAAWLAGHTGDLRKHPAAGEAFTDLHDACAQLARLVDRPADKVLVGMCPCGQVLYANHGDGVTRCKSCRRQWDVADSRETLRNHLDGKLVTATEAARLAQYLDSSRTQKQIRALIAAWIKRGQLWQRGLIRDEPTYRFGEVTGRLARTPRRVTHSDHV